MIVIVARHGPQNVFALVPKLVSDFEPVLRELDRLLDDDGIVQQIAADMARRAPHSRTRGRRSTPVEVVLRLLVAKRLYGWSYEEAEHFVGDSLVLRQFCRVYLEPVPDDTTLIRWANLVEPQTVERLNDRVVELARQLKVTRGRKLRVDSTVVETTIHHPTDSSLLADGVRVLSRVLRRVKQTVGDALGLAPAAFRTRTRSVRRRTQELHRLARRKGPAAAEALTHAYARLIQAAQQTRRQAARVGAALRQHLAAAGTAAPARRRRLQERVDQLTHFGTLVDQVLRQTVRRVLRGESVPAKEKLVSLFEPHTQLIQRHKPGKPVEFGRKLWLDEVDGGIVSRYALLAEAGPDHPHVPDSLAGHQARFGKPPELLAGDRGTFSPANETLAQQAGVRRVAIPHAGRASPARQRRERERWFRRGFRFRAGIEGRIGVLRRCYGLARCPDQGADGLGRYVGWGIVAHNLAKIAQTQAARTAPAAA
jgi:IS5 family transposase